MRISAFRHAGALTVALLADDAVDVDDELQAVARSDLALTTLVRSADDHDLVLGNYLAYCIRRVVIGGFVRPCGWGCCLSR